jgi:cellulose synthase/poly-beta-1,6-N-acetylglucosamine synthase-like glycosyltransferase
MPEPIDFQTVDLDVLLSDRSVQQLLDIVHEHPDWSIQQMVASHPKNADGQILLTYDQARAILTRLRLHTRILRRLRQSKIAAWEETDNRALRTYFTEVFPGFVSYLKHRQEYKQFKDQQGAQPAPRPAVPSLPTFHQPQQQPRPPGVSPTTQAKQPQPAFAPARPSSFTKVQLTTFQQFDRFLSLAKQFSITVALSFLIFFTGSLVFDTLFHAQTLLARIGMFFAFTALACGMLFFLYSLKYYLTIAVILSFSRSSKAEPTRGSGLGAFFSKLFGISITVEDGEPHPARAPAISLRLDLTTIQLERAPFVSIHVATYNEKRVIDRFLLAATSMDYPNYEVIVADDSTDETVTLLEQWKGHPKVKISHRTTREGYKGGALKQALTLTDPRAEFILVFDADFIPYPDAITQFLKYFQAMMGSLQPESIKQSPVAAVQGYQWHILNKSENWITKGVRSEYAGSYVIERSGAEVYQGLKQISGSVYMIRRDVLSSLGWGTSITEDFELTLRLYEQGYKVAYTPYIQTPAEAVSTIKRLIRQRMRWAEGHSFNVKRRFGKLLFSPKLTFSEKLEFLYLSPYYLQAFFFLLGTFCWFSAEMVFQTRLPFWTEAWGWSLVLTNLFALPLMNLVGLFMESSSERDYLGLFSFLLLSYIVAPFQAFAAVKGFLETEEGPWFRTPKTGRITDSFVPGRFYGFLKGLFGLPTPVANQVASSLFSPTTQAAFLPLIPGFAFGSPPLSGRKPKGMRFKGKAILALFLICVMLLNYATFFTPKAQATGNPTIEQQINLIDGVASSSGGGIGITTALFALIDTANYSGGTVSYYFEVVAKASSSTTGTAVLTYNDGTGATPSNTGPTLTISNINTTSYARYRSAAFSPTGTQDAWLSSVTNSASGTTTVQAARIIIVQSDTTAIKNSVTQIEVGNHESTTSATDVPLAQPKYWKYDSSKYDGTVTIYFETAEMATAHSSIAASLYVAGASCTTQISNTSQSTSAGVAAKSQRQRSADISVSLSSGTTYMVCINSASSGGAYLVTAKIVVQQTSSTGLTKTEIYHTYDNTYITNTTTTLTGQSFFNEYEAGNWAGGTFTYYFEATMKSSVNTDTVTAQICYQATSACDTAVGNTSTTSSTSLTLVRSSSFASAPPDGKELDAGIKVTTGGDTITVNHAALVIDVSSLQTPENLFPFLPLLIFLPKIVEYIKKRRQLRLAVTQHAVMSNKATASPARKTRVRARQVIA